MLQRVMLFLCLTAAITSSAQTPPVAGIDSGEIRIVPAKGTATATVTLFAPVSDATQPAPDATVTVLDVPLAGDTVKVAFNNIQPVANVGRYEWTSVAEISNLPNTGYESTRRGQLIVDGKAKYSFTYILSTKPKLTSWTAAANVNKVVWMSNHDLAVVVTPSGGAGGAIKVLRSTLTDPETDIAISPERFAVCAGPTPDPAPRPTSGATPDPAPRPTSGTTTTSDCTAPVLAADVPSTAYLRINGGDIPPGNYTGGVDLQIAGHAQPQSLAFTFHRSGAWWIALGVLLIAAGVGASAFVGIWARHRSARAAAMLPATRLADLTKEQVTALNLWIGKNVERMPRLREALSEILAALTQEKVNGFIGTLIPSPFGANANAASAFASYLQERSDRLSVLRYLIDSGVKGAVILSRKYASHPDVQKELEKALEELDELATDSLKKPADLTADIKRILEAMESALQTESNKGVRTLAETETPLPSTRQLLVSLDAVNLGVWLVWGAVTILLGTVVLILMNRGFGTCVDLAKCFFWGLGMQVAGDQFQQSRASSATAALGITLPS